MRKLKITLMCLLSLAAQSLIAQNKNCGLNQAEKDLYEKFPEVKAKAEQIEQLFKNNMIKTGKTRGTIVIPVVFHIVHNFGPENITDAQVYDAIKRINDDYNKLNADVVNTWPPFDTIIANCGFQFKLATIDPDGNCTNGIDRIVSYKTYKGNDQSKLNLWNPFKYLNIWVVNSIGKNGTAAYAYKPATADGIPFYDGIISLYDYVGGISPSQTSHMHTLSHEIGHYLNLDHTWGATNEPGVSCGDDGVNDTPETKGHDTCPLVDSTCHNGPENIQNFMEYSYCSTMFTRDQKTRMENTLNSNVAKRKNLFTDENKELTGVLLPRPDCKPHSEFKIAKFFGCTGVDLSLTAAAWGDSNYSYTWFSPDGSFSSTTGANTNVSFTTPGWKSVGLVATSNTGTDTMYKENVIYINDNAVMMSTDLNSFENPSLNDQWHSFNYFNNSFSWKFCNFAGFWGGNCLMYDAFDKRTGIESYYNSAQNDWDDIVTPAVDLASLGTKVYMNFEYSSTSGDLQLDNDSMQIYFSKDCGASWSPAKSGWFKSTELHIGYYGANEFVPTQASQWKHASISLPAAAITNQTMFRFQYRPDDLSNNLYIDNLEFKNGPTSVSTMPENFTGLMVFPNPSTGKFEIQGMLGNSTEGATIEVYNLTGQKVFSAPANLESGRLNQQIDLSRAVKSGSYMLKVRSSKQTKSALISVL